MYSVHPHAVNHFRRLMACLLLFSILLTGLLSTASAEDPTVDSTLATISFVDGELELGGDVAGSGLNFSFGKQTIPVAKIVYPAVNEKAGVPVDHVLQVEDARFASGDWHVTVSLTSFIDTDGDPAPSFGGLIILQNPAVANVNASAGTAGLTVTEDLQVSSGGGPVLAMLADKALGRGIYTATWKNEDVTLNLSDSEVSKIGLADYSATLNWTLNQGPM